VCVAVDKSLGTRGTAVTTSTMASNLFIGKWGGLTRVGNPLLLNFSGWFQRVNDPPLLNIFPPAQRVPTLRPSEFSKLSQHASEGPTLRPSEFSKHVRTFIICHIDHIKWLKTYFFVLD
jgi:hypothetical protein